MAQRVAMGTSREASEAPEEAGSICSTGGWVDRGVQWASLAP